jgi:hypothetical protein
MSVVLKVKPGGTTVVIKRFVAQQVFDDSEGAAAHALKRAKNGLTGQRKPALGLECGFSALDGLPRLSFPHDPTHIFVITQRDKF